ncbi:uncharacterized protein LOC143211626 [Lasioglossum baleicum]|uniref:uncharacterized protein LOC143211626 n=1 Tax=Lasioglossum baleicum TaxID=434251 RepID=UPI003FCD7F45
MLFHANGREAHEMLFHVNVHAARGDTRQVNDRLIVSRLKGHTRQWYDTRLDCNHTWHETKGLLAEQFHRIIPFSRLLKEAVSYEAKPGQCLGDYCFNKMNMIQRLDDKIIDMIIHGVPSGRRSTQA